MHGYYGKETENLFQFDIFIPIFNFTIPFDLWLENTLHSSRSVDVVNLVRAEFIFLFTQLLPGYQGQGTGVERPGLQNL